MDLNHTSAEPHSKEKMTFLTSTEIDKGPGSKENFAGPGSKENFNSLLADHDLNGTDIITRMYQLPNLDYLNEVSRKNLENIFKKDFPKSDEYKDLVLSLHDNMVEFNCWHQAGLL